jgi:hypothetical protein
MWWQETSKAISGAVESYRIKAFKKISEEKCASEASVV